MTDDDDPMAALRARYERFEGPLNRLENAVRAGGMRAKHSNSRIAEREIAFDGMCIGFITKKDENYVLEIAKSEATPEMMEKVRDSIAISQRNAATHAHMAMRGGFGMG